MRTHRSRRGFTLVALLVLLAIGGLFVAMFFPAILKARTAAQRASCRNNLHMIAIALHDFESDHKFFPGVGMGDPDQQKDDAGSWCFRLLPYLERDNLFKQNGGNVPVSTLYCVTRRPVGLYNELPKTDYAGNVGTADDPEKPAKEDGAFGAKKVKFASLVDGTSNIIMAGEKGLRIADYQTGKGKGDSRSCWVGNASDALRSSNDDQRPPKRDSDMDNERGFGSAHEKGANFAFCDGHVRQIGYRVDPQLFRDVCCRNDGRAVDLSKLSP